jgi:hypothetical protein
MFHYPSLIICLILRFQHSLKHFSIFLKPLFPPEKTAVWFFKAKKPQSGFLGIETTKWFVVHVQSLCCLFVPLSVSLFIFTIGLCTKPQIYYIVLRNYKVITLSTETNRDDKKWTDSMGTGLIPDGISRV